MAQYETVLIEKDGGVTTVTLNRPQKKNAMTPTMHREMVDVLTTLQRDKETRVLVITGSGDSFCAGEDLKEFFYDQTDTDQFEANVKQSIEWRVRLLRSFPAPTIASVNGWCFGGGFSIVASCDIVITADEAVYGLSEINFGTFPGGLVTKQVGDLLRPREALYYILTGDRFNGKRAAEIGFATLSVPGESLTAETRKVAEKLCKKDPLALSACKEAYRASMSMPDYEVALAYSMARFDQLSLHQKEAWKTKGIGQFLEGRYKPGFGPFDKESE